MRPEINEQTRDLAQDATKMVMERVKAAVVGAEDETKREQPSEAAEPDTNVDANSSSARGGTFNLKLDSKMPVMEREARESAHPLFVQLEQYVQQLAPKTMREALQEQLLAKHTAAGGPKGAHGAGPHDRATADQDRGLLDMLSSGAESVEGWFAKTSSGAIEKAIDVLVDSVKEPVAELINRLVAELEETSMSNAFAAVRAQLQQYHLLSKSKQEAPTA